MNELNDIMIALRYSDLSKRGKYVSEEQKKEMEKALDKLREIKDVPKAAELTNFVNRIYDFQKRVLHNYVDSGLLNEKQYKEITDLNPHYVPMQRVFEDMEATGGKNLGKAAIYKIEGSDRDVKNIFGSIAKNVNTILAKCDDNMVRREAAELADIFPTEIKIVETPKTEKHTLPFSENGEVKYMEVSK